MKKLFIFAVLSILAFPGFGQDSSVANEARWLRYPAISPDGQTILFGYMGNIYKVGANGGVAVPLTVGDAYHERPVWSHDGKMIAFSSDRYGNFDVFTMPANGGKATRITFHSTDDFPYDFTPDNTKVLFGGYREAPANSARFPGVRYFQNLYTIPANGGRPVLLTAAGVEEAHFNKDGNKIVFQDKKGYEDYYRKHHTSAITRDIWVYDIPTNAYAQQTTFKGEDRNPYFSPDGNSIFYTSEKNGELNVFKRAVNGSAANQLTHFKGFPVRALSISSNGKMAFAWKGDIYTYSEGQEPRKLVIQVLNNSGFNEVTDKEVKGITEFAVNPNGKEIAFVSRGEVFVAGIDDNHTKRITNTPQQERMVKWSPDGNTLLFSGERDGSWNIYKVTLENPKEKFFYAATTLKTEPLIATDAEEFQPVYSPDGKKVAYVENRNVLIVMDLKSGKKTTVLPEGHNYSYSDGDWSFEWSPDSKWLLVDDEKGYFANTNTALISADGQSTIMYPVNSGFGESNPKWAMGGKIMTYESSKLGRKSLAYQGSREVDIYAVFFDQKAYDEYTLSKGEYQLMKDRQDEKDKDKEAKKEKKSEKKEEKGKIEKVKPLELDLTNLEDRIVRLTINSASISDYVLNKDASKVYYLAAFEKGYDLWVTEPRTHETKILAKLSGSPSGLELSDDEKTIYLRDKDQLKKVDVATGKVEAIPVDADMRLNPASERQYIFNHVWKQVREKFYDPTIHGIDWKMYHDAYAEFLPYINNNYDFQVLLSEMLGELNASHTGARYYPGRANADKTASFGLLYDETYQGKGMKISAIIPERPLDKANTKVKAGDIIMKINNQEIAAADNWNQYLNNLEGKNVLLTIKRKGKTIQQVIQPVSLGEEHELMYKRWVSLMEKMTDSLSHGQIGYVHVRGMNDNSFRDVYANVLGKNLDKKALIVDTRFNGGGWLHNDLNTFLSGKEYLKFAPQGHLTKGGEPIDRWSKPSAVLMSEGNYSDAFIFPYVYKENKIGKLIGMPVAGTGTAVWWERQIDPTIVFGIPMVATIGKEGRPTENLELEPDIKVPLPYNKFLNGEDTQLEAAVKELLQEVKK